MLNRLDTLIIEFDNGLRTLLAKPRSVRAHPDTDIAEADLSDAEKKHAGALMRVNHTGEVCAQALYSGQALTAQHPETTAALKQAAQEETEHLAWCETRIQQLRRPYQPAQSCILCRLVYNGRYRRCIG